MRSSYVRTFYLPYHFPQSANYHSHYRSRKATNDDNGLYCACSRPLNDYHNSVCPVCDEISEIWKSSKAGFLSEPIMDGLKPIKCKMCEERFADNAICERHVRDCHTEKMTESSKMIIPSKMSVNELKLKLKELKKSTSGSKETLRRRLEGLL